MDSKSFYFQLFESTPSKGESRRYEIVLATIESINQFGVESSTFETIGSMVKLKASNVAYYFPKKEDAFDAAIKLVIGISQSYLITGVTENQDKLYGYVDAAYVYLKENPKHWCIFALFFYYASRSKRYRDIYKEMRKMGSERIATVLRNQFHLQLDQKILINAGDDIVRIVHNDGLQFIYSQNRKSLTDRRNKTWDEVYKIVHSLAND